MIAESFPVGPFQCNCTILACEETRSAVLIDPGGDADRILSVLSQHKLKLEQIIHTHAHLDHVGATDDIHKKLGGLTGLHEDDMPLYNHLMLQAELFGLPTPPTPTINQFLKDGTSLNFGNKTVEVIHTPGHSPGSLTFFVQDYGLLTGDTLFFGSVGRTDLWEGSQTTLLSSIKKKLLAFPDETVVYPGHGPKTAIGMERHNNPYL